MPNCCENWALFELDEATQIDLQKLKARDYYRLLLVKKHQSLPTGPERWNKDFAIDREGWRGIFRVVPKDSKLKEFQYKLLHRIVVKKKELFRYGINSDSDCLYCGEPDSINHTFIDCEFTKNFAQQVVDWF